MPFNTSSNQYFKTAATTLTIITTIIATLTIILNLFILILLFYYGKLRKRFSKSNSRRIGLLHSINTYIHIIGGTTIFLVMSIQTLYGDAKIHNKIDSPPSWHCRLLNYFLVIFSAGIYGSCFLHALFRFWRIIKPNKHLFQTFAFHVQLIIIYTISIMIIFIPIWFRSFYVPSENYCVNRYNDRWSLLYVIIISIAVPVFGIIIVYLRIVLFMKTNWQSRKRLKRMKREISTIRRIILFVTVVLTIGSAAVVVWLLTLIQKRLGTLAYRLLCFVSQISLLACSITLFAVSPQFIRALQSIGDHAQQ